VLSIEGIREKGEESHAKTQRRKERERRGKKKQERR
jgi:hypothetical protein